MYEDLDARVTRLENFIGNIDQIRLYANSLQEVIDKYLSPLYIESGSGKVMLVDGYLGDLNNIPHNVMFKIRASHDLVMQPEDEQAIIRFKRGEDYVDYTLRKMQDNHLVRLDSGSYISGYAYDIYINSQDVAIIDSNDTGLEALTELNAYKTTTNERLDGIDTTISDNYNTVEADITSALNTAKAYTDTKNSSMDTRVSNLETFLSPITKSGNNYTFPGNVTVVGTMQSAGLRTTSTVNFSGVSGFQLPNGSTISDPSANLGIANKQWVNTQITNAINDYHANMHLVGTAAASTALSGKPNGTFYYKLSS